MTPRFETQVLSREKAASHAGEELRRLLEQRLRIVCAGLAFSMTCSLLTNLLYQALGWPDNGRYLVTQGSHVACIVTSLVFYAALSRSTLEQRALERLSLLYQLAGSLGVAAPYYLSELDGDFGPPFISWLPVWIGMYPLVVPMTPVRSALGAFSSATVPVLLWLGALLAGSPASSLNTTIFAFAPNYVAAFLAVLPAAQLYRLSLSLSEARSSIEQLGSYRLEHRIGAGGMGEVWQARHLLLPRPAAIKTIKPAAGTTSPEQNQRRRERFTREAEVTSRLSSPNTVQLYDYGESPDGGFYYVMELLSGIELGELVRRFGPLPPARTISLLIQACDSLSEAHGEGLVHRDIKPANLCVCVLGGVCDVLKVLDFGLVLELRTEPATVERSKLTLPGHFVGSPATVSPELATNLDVDGRTDIYALGCVAYWLLSGRMPFNDSEALGIIMKHLSEAPDPLERVAAQALPEGLSRLIHQCLEKDPAQRPQSADELRRALTAIDLPAWSREDARAWWRINLPDLLG